MNSNATPIAEAQRVPNVWHCVPGFDECISAPSYLTALTALPAYDARVVKSAGLTGRDLEPWRAMLAVALWLQEAHGVAGLYDRLVALSKTYQQERATLEFDNTTRLHALALLKVAKAHGWPALLRFTTAEVTANVNALAHQDDLIAEGETYSDTQRTGIVLRAFRLQKHNVENAKGWEISRADLLALARSYSIVDTTYKPSGQSGQSEPSASMPDPPAGNDDHDGSDGLNPLYNEVINAGEFRL